MANEVGRMEMSQRCDAHLQLRKDKRKSPGDWGPGRDGPPEELLPGAHPQDMCQCQGPRPPVFCFPTPLLRDLGA